MTKKTANATMPPSSGAPERAPVVLRGRRRREQNDRRAVDRVEDPVRQDVVLEVDDRKRDERPREHEIRGQSPGVREAGTDRGEQHCR